MPPSKYLIPNGVCSWKMNEQSHIRMRLFQDGVKGSSGQGFIGTRFLFEQSKCCLEMLDIAPE